MLKVSHVTVLLVFLWTCSASAEVLTLKECLKKAAEMNPTLRVAAHNEKVAEEDVRMARSGYLPRMDIQGGYTAQDDAQAMRAFGQTSEIQEDNYASASLALTQTLYDFGRTSARYERAKALKEAAGFDYKGKEQDVFLQVVDAYYGIREAKKLLKTAEEEVAQMTEHLQVAKDFYEQGVSTLNDLLQAEVKLAASKQQKLAAANRVENRWLLLNFLINQKPEYRAELEEKVESEEALPSGGVEKAINTRAEIKALKKIVEGSKSEVEENKSNFAPELFARLAVDYLENDYMTEQSIMSATVGLKMNLFDGLATTSRYRRAVKFRSQNEERLRQLIEQIGLEYRTAVNDVRVAAERIRVTEKAIEQGEENLRITRDRYQNLVGTATDVIDAQTLLTQIRTDNYRAGFDYQVAMARVIKAMGEL
ncbi:MAG: TolC family protein [Syntrophobacterales bacterium CG_4_8_14_3_um_filter_49_14]|nr:MAG: TolC family protein [Syntrophobacterales bacterium CG_4_8_14_3_um_filter_49_14]